MKKKKFLLLASLAALTMASCSSFEEPVAPDVGGGMPLTRAGERAVAVPVESEDELIGALEDKEPAIYIASSFDLTQKATITSATTITSASDAVITSTAPIVCKANANFNGVKIDATTPVGIGNGAINLDAENITVELIGVNIIQNTGGTRDDDRYEGLGISNVTCNNRLYLKDTNITLTADKYVRGIDMYTAAATDVDLELDNCTITCGSINNLKNPVLYARCLSFSGAVGTKAGKPVIINNSTLQGAYYIVNSSGSRTVEVTVNGGTMDGRAAFNITSKGFVGNVNGTILIGENNFTGWYESFANIVFNRGCTNATMNLNGVTFKLMVDTYYNTNTQYAVSLREPQVNINLGGTITIEASPNNPVFSNPTLTYVSTNLTDLSGINVNQYTGYNFVGNRDKASFFLPATNQ